MNENFYQIVLLANAAWFGAGFWYFGVTPTKSAKLLIPRSARSSPIFPTMSAALPFLGGMNFAFSLLNLMLLVRPNLFVAPQERGILLIAFGVAHMTQFAINVPVAIRGGRIGETYWDVLKGPMLFIFVVDAAMTVLDFVCAAYLFA